MIEDSIFRSNSIRSSMKSNTFKLKSAVNQNTNNMAINDDSYGEENNKSLKTGSQNSKKSLWQKLIGK
jgi:hypothetical protein